jgi:hypothetical protein
MDYLFPTMSAEEAAQYLHVEPKICENMHKFDGGNRSLTIYFLRPVGSKLKYCLDCRAQQSDLTNRRRFSIINTVGKGRN